MFWYVVLLSIFIAICILTRSTGLTILSDTTHQHVQYDKLYRYLSYKLPYYTGISSLEKSRNNT